MLALPGARKREASHIIADQAHQSLTGCSLTGIAAATSTAGGRSGRCSRSGSVPGNPGARRERIVGFAERQRLPAIYQFREYALAGGLLSYGVSITDAYRQYGVYTARILNGAKPAEETPR
jgi:hypothetical protein